MLLDAFKRYRGIIFLHTPVTHNTKNTTAIAATITSCSVDVSSKDESLTLETDVSYKLTVAAGAITITAKTVCVQCVRTVPASA